MMEHEVSQYGFVALGNLFDEPSYRLVIGPPTADNLAKQLADDDGATLLGYYPVWSPQDIRQETRAKIHRTIETLRKLDQEAGDIEFIGLLQDVFAYGRKGQQQGIDIGL